MYQALRQELYIYYFTSISAVVVAAIVTGKIQQKRSCIFKPYTFLCVRDERIAQVHSRLSVKLKHTKGK